MCTLQLFGFLPLPPFLFGRGKVSDVTKPFKLAYFRQDTKPLEPTELTTRWWFHAYIAYESRHQHGAIDKTGGFTYFLVSPPFFWGGNDPNWRAYFSNDMTQATTGRETFHV